MHAGGFVVLLVGRVFGQVELPERLLQTILVLGTIVIVGSLRRAWARALGARVGVHCVSRLIFAQCYLIKVLIIIFKRLLLNQFSPLIDANLKYLLLGLCDACIVLTSEPDLLPLLDVPSRKRLGL